MEDPSDGSITTLTTPFPKCQLHGPIFFITVTTKFLVDLPIDAASQPSDLLEGEVESLYNLFTAST